MVSRHKKNSSKTVLVTGGAGYIGTHVVEKLLKEGYSVRIYDKFIFDEKSTRDFRKNKNFEVIKGDISDVEKLLKAMIGCGVVIHLAGLVGDPASAVDENLTRKINIISTRNVKEISKLLDVKKFIFASSCSVYGASNRIVNENSRLNPVSLYAKTKIDSEQELLNDRDDNFHPVILRFATVFGHSRRARFDLVANLFVAQAYHDGSITVTGGEQWRPFIHPKDIAELILRVIEAPLNKVSRQIINVGDEKLNMTISDLGETVGRIVKKDKKGKLPRVEVSGSKGDPRNYKVSFDKVKDIFKFRAKVSLRSGLEEIYENFKKNKYKGSYKDEIYSNFEMAKRQQNKL